jgi:hypothetical protein
MNLVPTVPQLAVDRASLDEGHAVRTRFSARTAPMIVVLLRHQETFSSRGQSYNAYQVRVTLAGLIVIDAIVDYPIIADPHAPLDLRRYDGPTAFALENAILSVFDSKIPVIAAHQTYTRNALQAALDALAPAQTAAIAA